MTLQAEDLWNSVRKPRQTCEILRAIRQTYLIGPPGCLCRGVVSFSSSSLTARSCIALLSPAALEVLALPTAATTAAWLATINPHIFPVPCTCTSTVKKQRLAGELATSKHAAALLGHSLLTGFLHRQGQQTISHMTRWQVSAMQN